MDFYGNQCWHSQNEYLSPIFLLILSANADCYTGWVSGTTVTLIDTWSPDSVNQPQLDTARGGTSDILYPSGSEANGKTTLSFTRLLNTGLFM